MGFDFHVVQFFSNYLCERKTQYFWNNFSSPLFDINIKVGQESALSPILSVLYLLPFLHILENQLKNLKIPIPISFLSFVDDGLSRSIGLFNPPPLDLSPIGGPILHSKEIWKYLGFIFDKKLSFHHHINFYVNKSISMVKCMKLLGNSVWRLNLHQKHLLYRSCILPITLYSFQLWYYNKAPLAYPLKQLGKMQRRVAIWILGAFKTFPSSGVKTIAGLIPINLHLKKLSGRSQL